MTDQQEWKVVTTKYKRLRHQPLTEEQERKTTKASNPLSRKQWQKQCEQMVLTLQDELTKELRLSWPNLKPSTDMKVTVTNAESLNALIKKRTAVNQDALVNKIVRRNLDKPVACEHSFPVVGKQEEPCSCKKARDKQIHLAKETLAVWAAVECEYEMDGLWKQYYGTWWTPIYNDECIQNPYSACTVKKCEGINSGCEISLTLEDSSLREVMLIAPCQVRCLEALQSEISSYPCRKDGPNSKRIELLGALLASCVTIENPSYDRFWLYIRREKSMVDLCLEPESNKAFMREGSHCHPLTCGCWCEVNEAGSCPSKHQHANMCRISYQTKGVSMARFGSVKTPESWNAKLMSKFYELIKGKRWTQKEICTQVDKLIFLSSQL